MASIVKLNTLAGARGKGIAFVGASAQLESPSAKANVPLGSLVGFTDLADSLTTSLDTAADPVTGYGNIGLNILSGDSVLTYGGHDVFNIGQDPLSTGIAATGIQIGDGGELNTGAGNERFLITLVGTGSVGVTIGNNAKLDLGEGTNNVRIDSVLHGLINHGTIVSGAGADKIDAASSAGVAFENTGEITLGGTDAGKDLIAGNSAGHAVLTPMYTPTKVAIYNSGTINLGGGKDVVDALVGGFGGGGLYNLGWTKTVNGVTTSDPDADAVFGFGAGTFMGGGGRNSITLPDGDYLISYNLTLPAGATGNAPAAAYTAHQPTSLRDTASGYVVRKDGSGQYDYNNVMYFDKFDGIGGNGLLGAAHFVNEVVVGGALVAQPLRTFTINPDGNLGATNYAV